MGEGNQGQLCKQDPEPQVTGCRKWTAVQNHVLRSPEASLRSDSGVKFSRVSSSRQEQAAQLRQSPGQMSPAGLACWGSEGLALARPAGAQQPKEEFLDSNSHS